MVKFDIRVDVGQHRQLQLVEKNLFRFRTKLVTKLVVICIGLMQLCEAKLIVVVVKSEYRLSVGKHWQIAITKPVLELKT